MMIQKLKNLLLRKKKKSGNKKTTIEIEKDLEVENTDKFENE